MAKQVENRVVEMEFKNKDFEKAVSVTMKSLEELNQKIDDLNKINTEGFDKLSQAANGVKFDTLFDNIDRLQDRLTTLGGKFVSRIQDEIVNIGINAFQSAANGLERAYDNVTSTIVNKGKTRAQNLAQAKFQLEALGVSWNKVYEDMNYAVEGTAYGIDEAAKAASQFAASNVTLGKDMQAALRGISGVAAMTGRSYTEIAQIFTTVAGTGRAMNGELNRIAERGLNAKKAIADYINKVDYFGDGLKVTQEQIFDLAKDGEISFDLFSKAMDTAFGEHATKANDLFTGALDNTKAALGRIGERFATPIYEDLRQILVALIPVINDFKKSLDPVVDSVTAVTGSIKELIVDGLEKIHGSFDQDDPFNFELFGKEIDAKGILVDKLEYIGDLINGIAMGIDANPVLNMLYNLVSVIGAIKDGIADVFGYLTGKDINYFMIQVSKFTDELLITDDVLESIRSVAGGIAAVFHMVFKTVSALWETGIKPMLMSISPLFGDIISEAGSLGEALKKIDEKYDPFPKMYRFFDRIEKHMVPFTMEIKKMFEAFKGFISELTGIHNFQELFEKLNKLASDLHISDIFYGIAGAIIYAFDALKNFVEMLNTNTGFKEYMAQLVQQNTVLTWIKDKFTAIKTTLNDLFSGKITLSQALGLDKLKEQFEWLTPVIDAFKEHYKSIFEAFEGEEGAEGLPFIQQFGEKLKEAILNLDMETIFGMFGAAFYTYFGKKSLEIKSYLAEKVGAFVDVFDKLTEGINMSLVKMGKETNAEKILKIAGAIALLAASVLLLGKMDAVELQQGIFALLITMGLIAALVVALAKVMKTTETFTKEYKKTETGITSKGKSKTKGKGKKRTVLEVLTEEIGKRFTDGKETVEKTIKDLSAIPALILSLGISIALIVGSIAKLVKSANGDYAMLVVASLIVAGIMALMAVIVKQIMTFATAQKDSLDADTITAIGKLFLLVGIAIKLIASSIASLTAITALAGDRGPASLMLASLMIGLILAEITAIVWYLTDFANSLGTGAEKKLLAVGGVMMMMAAAIQMLTIPIAALSLLMAIPGIGAGKVLLASVIIAGLTVAFAMIAALLAELTQSAGVANLLAGAAAMILMGMAVNALIIPIAAISALSAYNPDGLLDAITVINIMMIVMALLVTLFGAVAAGTGGLGAAGFLAGAAAMLIIAKAIQAMTLALGGFVAIESLAPGGIETAFKDLASGLASLCDLKVLTGLTALSITLPILATAIAIFGAGVLMFGIGVKDAGEGVLFFVSALALLQTIDFTNLAAKIAEAITAIINGVVSSLMGGRPQIEQGFLALIAAGTNAFVGSTGMLCEAAIKLLTDVIVAIDNHAQVLGFALGQAISKILLYASAGAIAGTGDFLGKILGLEEGDGLSEWLESRLLNKGEKKEGLIQKFLGYHGSFLGIEKEDAKKATEKDAENIGDGLEEGVEDNLASSNIGDNVMNVVKDKLNGSAQNVDMSSVGETLGIKVDDSLINSFAVNNGKSEMFGDMAEYGVEGWVDKLNKDTKAEKATNNWSLRQVEAGKKGLNEASPSKATAEMAKYFDEGFAIGIDKSKDSEKAVSNRASALIGIFSDMNSSLYSMQNSSLDPLKEAVANMATVASSDMDLTPTISPVLDMSNVQSGFSTLNSMFSNNRSIALAGEVSDLNAANKMLSVQIQNANRDGTNDTISSLGTKLEQLGEAIMNREIVLDSGELVGGLVNPMDRSLGVRAVRAQRGG